MEKMMLLLELTYIYYNYVNHFLRTFNVCERRSNFMSEISLVR